MKESFLKSFLIISIKINFLQNVSLVFSGLVKQYYKNCKKRKYLLNQTNAPKLF